MRAPPAHVIQFHTVKVLFEKAGLRLIKFWETRSMVGITEASSCRRILQQGKLWSQASCCAFTSGYCTDMYLKSPVTPMFATTPRPNQFFISGLSESWISLDSFAVQLTCCRMKAAV